MKGKLRQEAYVVNYKDWLEVIFFFLSLFLLFLAFTLSLLFEINTARSTRGNICAFMRARFPPIHQF